MSKKQKEALGKGIRALLETIDTDVEDTASSQLETRKATVGSIASIAIDKIEINPFQPRVDFNKDSLQELANSIKIHGIVQPVTVRKLFRDKFQVIAGERRLRAAKMAGINEVPAYIRIANDQEMLEIGLIENIQREDLNAIEIAINYQRLLDECTLKQEELAERVGKDRTTVTNYLRLLKLPPEIQKGIKEQTISMGHARALIGVEDLTIQLAIYKDIVKRELSVRKTEQLVRKAQQSGFKSKQTTTKLLPFTYQKVQDRIASHLSTKVLIRTRQDGKGEIIITYFSDDDLNRILDIIE